MTLFYCLRFALQLVLMLYESLRFHIDGYILFHFYNKESYGSSKTVWIFIYTVRLNAVTANERVISELFCRDYQELK